MKIQINAEGFKDQDKIQIQQILESIGLSNVTVLLEREWDDFISTLPNTDIEGFSAKIDEWFMNWGAGGGDYSTEENIRSASESNNPREWSLKAYEAVAGYCQDHFQAHDLISLAVEMVLKELSVVSK